MPGVFTVADNIISPLGFTTEDNWNKLESGTSGIAQCSFRTSSSPVFAAMVDADALNALFEKACKPRTPCTRFEKLVILSIADALENSNIDVTSRKTLIIISSTKGNIDLLGMKNSGFDESRILMAETGKVIQNYFGNPNTPVVVSNACISGVLAIIIGKRLIDACKYENVIVCGADIISDFVVSGFQSLKALAGEPCRPFDIDRKGLNLGEGSATIILSSNKKLQCNSEPVFVLSGASDNDANHISGPSRDGQGLFEVIEKTLRGKDNSHVGNIDYISAHGTATGYNDEMEAKAISRCGLLDVPVNSLKGYYGHTLGAAGVIESVIAINSMKRNTLLKSAGFNALGVSSQIDVIKENKKAELKRCIKIASGFGGCNAAVLFSKHEN